MLKDQNSQINKNKSQRNHADIASELDQVHVHSQMNHVDVDGQMDQVNIYSQMNQVDVDNKMG